jgi:flagellar assembly protein FliH
MKMKMRNPEDSEQVRALIDEAFADGAEQGRAETMAAHQARVDKAVGALQAAVEEMARQRRHDIRRMETETVRLALAIAKKIIGTAADQGETIAHVVKAAMQKVADPRQLLLRLNPADIEAVDAFKQELLMDGDVGAVMRLEADDTIERGGCVIETGRGDIDARIEQQIKVIEALLEDQLPPLPADA